MNRSFSSGVTLSSKVDRLLHSTEMTEMASDPKHCRLNDDFGLLVQGILAAVAFSTLILKRLREPLSERRPVLIWFFDTSKQAVGAMLVHFANIFLANLFKGDPCTWYLINFLLDSTLGLVVIYLCLQFMQVIVRMYDWDNLRFGEYGNPPQCKAWAGQCFLYLWAVIIEKATITLLVQLNFWEEVRRFILLPVKNHPRVELAISMLIIPFVFNAIMFWVVDNFLMRKKKKLLQKEDTRNKVKYERRAVMNGSDEEAVLLENMTEGESLTIPDDNIYHRGDTVRR
ncbi:store-operated calcium entry regulator STIMATE-like isoform X1 [Pocillopora damicornis]|uniref:store-operated calcium entry regulator STIMATE-like isoform X1 n=1 Tax=Pocillopora damicornis TaxID=46731 RepID=UPI000F54DF70|nr:store-operated calcium entry regulator STIMATE-like isoform X1 [Pocillopora damicornis]XP_058957700.1 store-operated calcium entry regulator STIMATE-like [Pocillopora verrucosa]